MAIAQHSATVLSMLVPFAEGFRRDGRHSEAIPNKEEQASLDTARPLPN